jgi:ABC-type glucose/galactose transport system permease subunit
MQNVLQALKSRTVLKAIALGVLSIIVAVLTELDLVAYVGVVNMVVDIFLRSVTSEPLSSK